MISGILSLGPDVVMKAVAEYFNRRVVGGNEIIVTEVEESDGFYHFDVEPKPAPKSK
jgi:hypothetical protein